jgi:hypothetical protein
VCEVAGGRHTRRHTHSPQHLTHVHTHKTNPTNRSTTCTGSASRATWTNPIRWALAGVPTLVTPITAPPAVMSRVGRHVQAVCLVESQAIFFDLILSHTRPITKHNTQASASAPSGGPTTFSTALSWAGPQRTTTILVGGRVYALIQSNGCHTRLTLTRQQSILKNRFVW